MKCVTAEVPNTKYTVAQIRNMQRHKYKMRVMENETSVGAHELIVYEIAWWSDVRLLLKCATAEVSNTKYAKAQTQNTQWHKYKMRVMENDTFLGAHPWVGRGRSPGGRFLQSMQVPNTNTPRHKYEIHHDTNTRWGSWKMRLCPSMSWSWSLTWMVGFYKGCKD